MQAIIHTSTRNVVFLFDDAARVQLTAAGLTGVVNSPDITATTHTLEIVPDNDLFIGNCWQYDGAWVATDQVRIDALVAARNATIRADKIPAIKAERDRRKFGGVFVSGKWIHSDTYSRTQWMGMVMMGASVPAIPWTTMDGTSITTSQALAGAVFQSIAQLDATLFAYAKGLITAVEASSDPASVDIASGWPATFESAV